LHIQLLSEALPANDVAPLTQERHVEFSVALNELEYLPFAHSSQSAEPAEDLKVPGEQAVQFDPEYPASHRQSTMLLLATDVDREFFGHNTQSSMATSSPYFPGSQRRHSSLPLLAL
jgi:hypothetical protein